jgi:hypothetical protein
LDEAGFVGDPDEVRTVLFLRCAVRTRLVTTPFHPVGGLIPLRLNKPRGLTRHGRRRQ